MSAARIAILWIAVAVAGALGGGVAQALVLARTGDLDLALSSGLSVFVIACVAIGVAVRLWSGLTRGGEHG